MVCRLFSEVTILCVRRGAMGMWKRKELGGKEHLYGSERSSSKDVGFPSESHFRNFIHIFRIVLLF